ncbi:hypothetical protein ACLVWU_07620 [Bdellovibrio sp. HCB290]|uniref:hypothetical protein n=1 Tax=Bdellovibrio sp. HCB290 TaxID=3394356 RepID=UPI0039B464CD
MRSLRVSEYFKFPVITVMQWVAVLSLILTPYFSSASVVACEGIFAESTPALDAGEALSTLYSDTAIPWSVRLKLGKELGKLPWINRTHPEKISSKSKVALLSLLNEPVSVIGKDLRKKLFELVPLVLESKDAKAYLLPVARGVRLTVPEDLYFAHTALKHLALATPVSHDPVARITNLGGGWNTTLLVEFVGGKKAVFKPFLGQKNLGQPEQWVNRVAFNREVTAVTLVEKYLRNQQSREMNLSPLSVPDTVEVSLVHDGIAYGVGSLQTFVEGYQGVTKFKSQDSYSWIRISEGAEWRAMEARVRTLDYILGNPDRFENPGYKIPHYEAANLENLMIPKNTTRVSGIKAILIDNAFGRPGAADFNETYLPPLKDIPQDLQRAILNFDKQGFTSEMKNQLPDEGIQDVLQRIEKLQSLLGDRKNL